MFLRMPCALWLAHAPSVLPYWRFPRHKPSGFAPVRTSSPFKARLRSPHLPYWLLPLHKPSGFAPFRIPCALWLAHAPFVLPCWPFSPLAALRPASGSCFYIMLSSWPQQAVPFILCFPPPASGSCFDIMFSSGPQQAAPFNFLSPKFWRKNNAPFRRVKKIPLL